MATNEFCNLAIDSVSINQLIFFASSNLLCGLINITIQTLHRSFVESLLLLLGYSLLPTFVFVIYYKERLFDRKEGIVNKEEVKEIKKIKSKKEAKNKIKKD